MTADDLMSLAEAVGVVADSEGHAGGAAIAPGAVPSLPPIPSIPPWVASRRRLAELGVGPVYHGLPRWPL